MRFLLIIFTLIGLGTLRCSAQDNPSDNDSSMQVFGKVEVMPEFPGGQAALTRFINKNLRYPAEARENGIEGKVVVEFVVSDKGKISDIHVLHDIGGGCGQEVVHVVKSMPAWKPGMENNVPVNVNYKLPVSFMLGEEADANRKAAFIGGDEMFHKYVERHLKYPREAKKNNLKGTLMVSAQIDALGSLKSFKFNNALGYGCEEAVTKLLKSVKHWNAAHKNGRAVDGTCELKFPFPPR